MDDPAFKQAAGMLEEEDKESHVAKALSGALQDLSKEEKIKLFTNLTDEEIKNLSVLMTVNDDLVDDFAEEFLVMKVSEKRKGRKELIEVAKAFSSIWGTEEQGKIGQAREFLGI